MTGSNGDSTEPIFHGIDFIEVEDFDSPEAIAAKEWIEKHHQYLPPSGEVLLSDVEFERYQSILTTFLSNEEAYEKALMILGHAGTLRSIKALKKFLKKGPPNLKLKIWAELALSECQKFYKNLSEGVGPTLTISTVEENVPSTKESITITYDSSLQKITGVPYDRIPTETPEPFMIVMKTVLEYYPEIESKYPPGKLGIELNGKPPTGFEQLRPGSQIHLRAF